ncbi:MAG: hypothetical protein K8H88_24970, partial [Sandaracinaceae bacterium]|nr:hypothetical protein [Sandaracinaceae bacterium]
MRRLGSVIPLGALLPLGSLIAIGSLMAQGCGSAAPRPAVRRDDDAVELARLLPRGAQRCVVARP